MDNILISIDGDVIIINDSATIIVGIEVTYLIAKLLIVLSALENSEISDKDKYCCHGW